MVFKSTKTPIRHLSVALLVLSVAGSIISFPSCQAVPLSQGHERPAGRLDQLEQSEADLESRLNALEIKYFGHKQAGPVSVRLKALEKALGHNSPGLTSLKPLVPQLDISKNQLPEAKDKSANTASSSRTHEPKPESATADLPPPSPEPCPKIQPSQVRNLLEQGIAAHRAGNVSKAESFFKQVLNQNHGDVNANFSLGTIAEQKGDLESALGYYRASLAVQPNDREFQRAVAEVENQIANGGPFRAPVAILDDGKRVLQGRAADFGANAPSSRSAYFGAPGLPVAAPNSAFSPYSSQVQQSSPPPVLDVSQCQPQVQPVQPSRPSALSTAAKSVLFQFLPEPIHCPVCGWLSRF